MCLRREILMSPFTCRLQPPAMSPLVRFVSTWLLSLLFACLIVWARPCP